MNGSAFQIAFQIKYPVAVSQNALLWFRLVVHVFLSPCLLTTPPPVENLYTLLSSCPLYSLDTCSVMNHDQDTPYHPTYVIIKSPLVIRNRWPQCWPPVVPCILTFVSFSTFRDETPAGVLVSVALQLSIYSPDDNSVWQSQQFVSDCTGNQSFCYNWSVTWVRATIIFSLRWI